MHLGDENFEQLKINGWKMKFLFEMVPFLRDIREFFGEIHLPDLEGGPPICE